MTARTRARKYERDRSRRSQNPSPEPHQIIMAEPPSKRAKRTDSSAMWDRNDNKARTDGRNLNEQESRRGGRDEDKKSRHREDRRNRSRSPERSDRRRDRSRSKDRAKGGRDGGERKVRESDTIRDKNRSRKDDPPPRKDRHRSRSRSPRRNNTRKPQGDRPVTSAKSHAPATTAPKTVSSQSSVKPPTNAAKNGNSNGLTDKMDVVNDAEDEETAAERAMQEAMGFAKFKTTKNTKVPGNNVYAVRKEKKTEYRQYMNRVGGFNRPLSPSRD